MGTRRPAARAAEHPPSHTSPPGNRQYGELIGRPQSARQRPAPLRTARNQGWQSPALARVSSGDRGGGTRFHWAASPRRRLITPWAISSLSPTTSNRGGQSQSN